MYTLRPTLDLFPLPLDYRVLSIVMEHILAKHILDHLEIRNILTPLHKMISCKPTMPRSELTWTYLTSLAHMIWFHISAYCWNRCIMGSLETQVDRNLPDPQESIRWCPIVWCSSRLWISARHWPWPSAISQNHKWPHWSGAPGYIHVSLCRRLPSLP